MIKCRKCGKGPNEITGYLARVNPKDEAGIWECAPSCHAKMTQEEAVLAAIEGKQPAAQSEREALEFERLLNRAIALSRDSRCEEARAEVLRLYDERPAQPRVQCNYVPPPVEPRTGPVVHRATIPEPAAPVWKEVNEAMRAQHDNEQPAAQSEREAWRPIETAPKDGTLILLGRFVKGCKWDRTIETDYWHQRPKHNYEGWGEFNAQFWPPTHWMPLPEPPR